MDDDLMKLVLAEFRDFRADLAGKLATKADLAAFRSARSQIGDIQLTIGEITARIERIEQRQRRRRAGRDEVPDRA